MSRTSEASTRMTAALSGPAVLVVDPEHAFREQVAGVAAGLGLGAECCETAEMVLLRLRQRRAPACVILNVRELESAARRIVPLLAHQPHRVVLISDAATPPVTVATQIGVARHLNLVAVLEKPVDDAELGALLARRPRRVSRA